MPIVLSPTNSGRRRHSLLAKLDGYKRYVKENYMEALVHN